jgi:hypothetical protein
MRPLLVHGLSRNKTTSLVTVRPAMLAKGDLQPLDIDISDYATFADLTPERIKELYIAGRFSEERERAERLQQEVDTLRALHASKEEGEVA